MSNKCRGVELANVRGQNVLRQHSLQTSGPIKRRLSSSLHLHMASKTEIWEQHTSLRKRVVMQWSHIRHCSTRRMSVSPNQTHQHIIMIEKENKTAKYNILCVYSMYKVFAFCAAPLFSHKLYFYKYYVRLIRTDNLFALYSFVWFLQIFFFIHCRNNIVLQSVSKELLQNKIQQ